MKKNLFFKRFLFLWILAFSASLWGQTNIIPTRTDVAGFPTWSDTDIVGTTYLQLLKATSKTITPAMNFNSYTSETLNFKARSYGGTNAVENVITVSISVDNGASFVILGTRTPTSSSLIAQSPFDLSPYNGTQFKIKFSVGGTSDTVGAGIDDIVITGIAATTSPAITATPTTLSGFTYTEGTGPSVEQSFTASGSNLTDNITVTAPANFEVSTTSGSGFSSAVTLTQTGGTVASTIVYARMVAGLAENIYGGNMVLSSTGAINVNVVLSGEVTAIPLDTPVATVATNITSDSFTANWNTVSEATNYELDVYTGTDIHASTITETFTDIGGGNSTSYTTRNWTGIGSIGWTAYKARTDQEIFSDNAALTLQNESGAYLESEAISNGLTNISFDVQQFFSGSGGVLTVKVLTGPTFTTETTIGIISYNTTASNYDSGAISGITGDYKIRIENNISARAAIDNLSFIGLASSTRTYVMNAADVGNITSYNVTGLDSGTAYNYVVRAKSGAATSGNSNEIEVTTLGTPQITWDGNAWSNGTGPTSATDATIDGDYTIGNSFEAKSLTVNANKTLTVNSSVTTGDVTNNGAIIVNDNASFIQTSAGTYGGYGTFTVNRNSVSATGKYAFWSSPVQAQNMYDPFPGTTPTYVMTYNTTTDFYDVLPNPATSAFGQGYSIKTPVPAPTAAFVGTPNNGSLTTPLTLAGQNYNLVGNPYPSNLDLTAFYAANSSNIESTLWFWDNTSGSVTTQTGNTTTNLGYATYNAGSGTWVNAPNGSATPSENYAKIGQAFIVEAAGTSLSFDNTLRAAAAGDNFNKTAAADTAEGKFWLKLNTPYNSNMMQAVTYQDAGSNEYDIYDSSAIGTGSDAFYSFAGTEKVVIQGKAPFNTDDVVVLGNKHFESGNFKIELVKTEGLFANGQAIYLKDKITGTETNLQEGVYTFSSDAGEFSNRFEIVYKNATLATDAAVKSEVSVYRSAGDFVISSPSKISSVEVYDVSGRLLQSLSPNAAKATVTNLSKGVFIIKIKNASGSVSKKMIK